jgi:hypothetical protein
MLHINRKVVKGSELVISASANIKQATPETRAKKRHHTPELTSAKPNFDCPTTAIVRKIILGINKKVAHYPRILQTSLALLSAFPTGLPFPSLA